MAYANKWGVKIQQWQKDLIKALRTSGSALSSEEITKFEGIFVELESSDLPSEVISSSRLPEILGYIASARGDPPYDHFPFKARATVLIKKWRRLEAATMSAVLSDQFPPSGRPAALLPREVLMHIIQCYVGDASINDDPREYRQKRDFLLDCTLVAKDWSVVAINLLYRGPIILSQPFTRIGQALSQADAIDIHADFVRSIELLLRTIENGLETPCPIQQLKFENLDRVSWKEFAGCAVLLISRCTEMRHLDADIAGLSFAPDVPLLVFGGLLELRLANETLRLVAPLLHKMPSLKVLHALWIEPKTPRVRVKRMGAPVAGDSLQDIIAPTFMLRELRLCQCEFAREQWQWLLSSSTAIDYVELQEISDSAEDLSRVIGPHVKSLHLKGMMDAPQQGDDRLAAVISMFTALTSLRISGGRWPWVTLLADIKPSLEAFTISYSKPGCEGLARVLSGASWQPHLRTVTVHHWANVDYFYRIEPADVRRAKLLLEGACALRKLSLNWITEGASQVYPSGGLIEADGEM